MESNNKTDRKTDRKASIKITGTKENIQRTFAGPKDVLWNEL